MNQGFLLSLFIFTSDGDVTELARLVWLCEVLHAGDLVLISKIFEGFRNRFRKWKAVFENNGLKVSVGKTYVMAIGGIIKGCVSM